VARSLERSGRRPGTSCGCRDYQRFQLSQPQGLTADRACRHPPVGNDIPRFGLPDTTRPTASHRPASVAGDLAAQPQSEQCSDHRVVGRRRPSSVVRPVARVTAQLLPQLPRAQQLAPGLIWPRSPPPEPEGYRPPPSGATALGAQGIQDLAIAARLIRRRPCCTGAHWGVAELPPAGTGRTTRPGRPPPPTRGHRTRSLCGWAPGSPAPICLRCLRSAPWVGQPKAPEYPLPTGGWRHARRPSALGLTELNRGSSCSRSWAARAASTPLERARHQPMLRFDQRNWRLARSLVGGPLQPPCHSRSELSAPFQMLRGLHRQLQAAGCSAASTPW